MNDLAALIETALADPERGAERLAALPAPELDAALRALAADRREAALPVMTALAERGSSSARRAAKRALYRLAQAGITPPSQPSRPVVPRQPERTVRAWMSGIDGTGARAVWLLFEGAWGGLALCSVLISDTAGILDVAGGEITKKRLEAELAQLRAEQKLPWVELPPEHVVARVAGARALHAHLGTSPPPGFARWEKLLTVATADAAALQGGAGSTLADPALVEQSAKLFALPELMGWFLEPERVQADAVRLLEARSSRLVVSDQVKAERERAIVDRVIERELDAEARARWAFRLGEMALIFELTGRPDHAAPARATARALADAGSSAARIPFARSLAERALEVAAEIASGRIKAEDVGRRPGERER